MMNGGSPVQKCTRCDKTKHVDEFHRDKNRWNGLSPKCKQCAADYYAKYSVENAKKNRAKRNARHKERMETDPEYAARHRANAAGRQREQRKRDMEKVREQARKAYRRRRDDPERWAVLLETERRYYREKIQSDPERHAAYLEVRRINRRLRRIDAGLPVRKSKLRIEMQTVPSAPLRPFVAQWIKGSGYDGARKLARLAGVSERLLYRLQDGKESENVQIDAADKICVALGIPLSLVYDIEEEK